ESVTVTLSVPLDDSRTKATRRCPGAVVMGTENEVKAAPLTSMLFWTCTNAGPEPVVAPGFTVSVAVCEVLLQLAITVATTWLVTDGVVAVKVALVAPAATVTLAGISAAALLIDRLTAAPPLGAAPLK